VSAAAIDRERGCRRLVSPTPCRAGVQHAVPNRPLHPRRIAQGGAFAAIIPLIDFAFDSPRGQKTKVTAIPGLTYVADSWQVGTEAVLPLTHGSGIGIGVNLQVQIFLDDFMPSLFGRPVFSD
jgi:hypothetical protein